MADKPRVLSSQPGRRKYARLAAVLGLSGVLTIVLLALHGMQTVPLRQVSYLIFDSYQRIKPRPYTPLPVKIVDIDEASLQKLGQWPWPRTRIAELVDRLRAAGAAAIAFDVVFAEPDRTSPKRLAEIIESNPSAERSYDELSGFVDHDDILAQSFARAPVVDGVILTGALAVRAPAKKAGFVYAGVPPLDLLPSYAGAITSLPELQEAATGTGMISILGDRDRIVRRVQLLSRVGDVVVPSLALDALRVAQGAKSILVKSSTASGETDLADVNTITRLKVGQVEIPTNETGEVWVYYTKPEPRRLVSAADVLFAEKTAEDLAAAFAGHIVFVGTGAAGLRDIVATPIAPYDVGVTVHANVVEQALTGTFLERPDWSFGFERSMIVAIAVVITASVLVAGAVWSGVLTAAVIAGHLAFSWHAFSVQNFLVDPVFPVLSAVAFYALLTGFRFFQSERERAQVRQAFGQYLSPVLVERIADNPSVLRLGGEQRDLTVMFCDIRNFSRLSENLDPQALTGLLNSFLTPMTEILLDESATIDKYIGDSIMAFWNAPLETAGHEQKSVLAALKMRQRVRQLNAELGPIADHVPFLEIGIGLNSGPCCVGNLGSENRFSYSAIGDTVNLSSRLEGLTKQLGVALILGERTARGYPGEDLFELDLIRVVGRATAERIFTVVPQVVSAGPGLAGDIKTTHTDMLAAYRSQHWPQALDFLERLQSDYGITLDDLKGYYSLMRDRIHHFQSNPPASDWDGVFVAEQK